MTTKQGNWKSEPDEYFSWALSISAISKGHLLVDFVPEDNMLYEFTGEETQLIGIAFEGAIRYCLDSPNVTRLSCSKLSTPESLYHAVARPMKKLMVNPPSMLSKNIGSDNIYNTDALLHQQKNIRRRQLPGTSSDHAGRLNSLSRQARGTKMETEKLQRMHEERTREMELKLPYVLVVQGIDLLPRNTQLALLELMVTGVMPVKLVTMSNGSDPVAVPGMTQLPHRFMIVALTNHVPEHTVDYDSIGRFPEVRKDGQQRSKASLLPALFDEFLLRIPLKLPPRRFLKGILRQKVKMTTPVVRLQSSIHHEISVRDEENIVPIDESSDSDAEAWILASKICLLWPSPLKVASKSHYEHLQSDSMKLKKAFARVTRIQRAQIDAISSSVMRVHVSLPIKQHLRDIITSLRSHTSVVFGPSTQTLHILERVIRAVAHNQGSKFVSPYHILSVVVEMLAHRIVVKTSREIYSDSELASGKSEEGHYPPQNWHPVTAGRLIVAQVYEHYVPVQR